MGTRGGWLSLPCGATAGDLLSSVPSRSSNCDLDYDLYRDDFPYRVYEYQKIPPLINRIPVKARRTHAGAGGKSSPSPQPGARSSSSSSTGTRTKRERDGAAGLGPAGGNEPGSLAACTSQCLCPHLVLGADLVVTRRGGGSRQLLSPAVRAEELHSIKGELSQIKAQVDSLLESLDRMDQRRERLSGCKESEKKRAEAGAASPSPVGEGSRGKEGTGGDGHLRAIDSAEESTDTEETMKTHISDPEGSH
ncbi:RNA-binding Raly-like protein [Aix galericulata]|nr:RNA-binding Raly-like protein [Aix galericulata]